MYCHSPLPLQLRASVGFHWTQARAEPHPCSVASDLQYGVADQQTHETFCLRICPGTEEASLDSRLLGEMNIGHSSLVDAAWMFALCLRRGSKSKVLSPTQPHTGTPALTPSPTQPLELNCTLSRWYPETGELVKRQVDVVLRPQSLEAPGCLAEHGYFLPKQFS